MHGVRSAVVRCVDFSAACHDCGGRQVTRNAGVYLHHDGDHGIGRSHGQCIATCAGQRGSRDRTATPARAADAACRYSRRQGNACRNRAVCSCVAGVGDGHVKLSVRRGLTRDKLAAVRHVDREIGEGAAQQNLNVAVAVVGDDHIGMAVAIELAQRHIRGMGANAIGIDQSEGARSVAIEHADLSGVVVRDHNVRKTVAVHVANGDSVRLRASGVRRRAIEGSVAVSEIDRNRSGSRVRYHQIRIAI